MVHGRARIHERDEDGVGQIKEVGDGEFDYLCSGSVEDLEGIVALGRRPNTHQHWKWKVYRFGPQNRRHIRCGRMAVAEGRWRPRDTCVEVKRSREGDMSVRCSSKKLDGFTPKGYLG